MCSFLFHCESDFRAHEDNNPMDESTILDALRDVMEADQAFFGIVRYLNGPTRSTLLAAHLRNTGAAINVIRQFATNSQTTTMVMNIPLRMDMSGNFFDAVPVYPTQEQIRAATETHVGLTNATCSICQDAVTCATRIRHCGHAFHGACIDQWLSMNPRCPVCRHDIRTPLRTLPGETSNVASRSVHTDEE